MLVGIMPSGRRLYGISVHGCNWVGVFKKITYFRVFEHVNKIPGTLRNCTFNIRFANGWRGCVRLAEAL